MNKCKEKQQREANDVRMVDDGEGARAKKGVENKRKARKTRKKAAKCNLISKNDVTLVRETVEETVLDSLGEVVWLEGGGSVKVSDGAGYLEDTIEGAGGKA